MKKLIIVLLVLFVAGTAFAAKENIGSAIPHMAGTMDPNRDALLCFDFAAVGLDFLLMDEDPATGSVNSAFGDFVMNEPGTGGTWASDLTLLVANIDLSVILIAVGGDFVDFGATYAFAWPEGRTSAGGPGGGNVDFLENIDITGYYLFVGNGWTSTEENSWTGCVSLFGDVVANEEASFGAVKALFR